jgi:Mg-chelatase subunit ChlD
MNTDFPTDPREALEASLTALLLDELPADQSAFLRDAIARDPELARRYERLKQTIDLVRITAKTPAEELPNPSPLLKLSQHRREELLQHFKTAAPMEFAKKPKTPWLIPLSIAALLIAVCSLVLVQAPRDSEQIGTLRLGSEEAPRERSFALLPKSKQNAAGKKLDKSQMVQLSRGTDNLALSQAVRTKTGIVLPTAAELTAAQKPASAQEPDAPALTYDKSAFYQNPAGLPIEPTTGLPMTAASGGGGQGGGGGRTAMSSEEVKQQVPTSSTPGLLNMKIPIAGIGDVPAGILSTDTLKNVQGLRDVAQLDLRHSEKIRESMFAKRAEPQSSVSASDLQAKAQSLKDGLSEHDKEVKDAKGHAESFAYEVSPGAALAWSVEQTTANLGFLYSLKNYEDRLPGTTGSHADQAFTYTAGNSNSQFGELPQVLLSIENNRAKAGRLSPIQEAEAATNLSYNLIVAGDVDIEKFNGGVNASSNLAARDDQSFAMIPRLQASGVEKESQSNKASLSANADTEKLQREGKMEAQIKTWDSKSSLKLAGLDKKSEDMLHQKNGNVLPSGGVQSAEQRAFNLDGRKLTETLAQPQMKKFGDSDNDAPLAKQPTAAPMPQPEMLTLENAFSTFSLNVSDVSFKLAAASLEKGVMPDPAGIRVEEFINAFDYRDPEPAPGVPIAFMSERAQYPFAQNRDLLRFSLKTAAQGRQAGRPLNLVLLLDNSGSMERADRVRIIQEALRVLAAQLQAQDTFSVVTFARTARLWVDGIPGNQAGKVAEQISGLTPQGGTNLEEAMNLAYQTALRHYLPNGINRVVLLTDGAANLGNVEPEALKQKVETNRKQGIALDCFGIGWEGYNDDLLEVLTRNGDGRYGFINTPEEAAGSFANQLAGALHVAAADVKVQVEFNPSRVTAYRQIGYARHQLTKEQFRDNTVDAAEIGAAESGNALYVVEVNPNGEGPIATVRVRYKIPGTAEFHEHEWPVPYTGKANSLQQASPALRLAASASAFGEWLSSSPYAAEVTPDALLGYLNGIPEMYGADTRPKTLEWMVRQAKAITGK